MDYFQSISSMTHYLDAKKVRKALLALILALLILNLECVNAQTSPVTQINYPVNGGNYNSIPAINGLVSGTGIVNVTISIKRDADGKYWDGVLWRDDEARLLATIALPNWAYTASVSWTDGSYKVNSRAGNSSGNIEYPGPTIAFTYDTTAPTSTITVPADGTTYGSMPTISGTASDAGSGVQQVEIRIQRPDLRYWDGDSWEVAVTWLLTTGTPSSWTYDSSSITWTEGNNKVRSRATDYAGNVQSPTTENTFTFDTNVPVSQITSPANGGNYSSIPAISGIANDPVGTITLVEITIQRLNDSKYWDGASWQSFVVWLPHDSLAPPNWAYTSSVTWDDSDYTVRSRATDNLATVESPGAGNTFWYDTTAPTSTITVPADGATYGSMPTISGTASDAGSGVQQVEIRIQRPDLRYWDGDSWEVAVTWLLTTGTPSSWTYDSSSITWTEGNNKVRSRATDYAGNVQSPTTENTFTFDTNVPVSQITSPANGGNYSSIPAISGIANDPVGTITLVEITIQRLSDSKYWDGTLWQDIEIWLPHDSLVPPNWAYTSSVTWTDSDYTVRSRATDNLATVESPGAGNTFWYDTTAPTSTITVPADGATYGSMPTISGTASDAGSGVQQVEIRIQRPDLRYWDGDSWEVAVTWLLTTGTTSSWTYDSSSITWTVGNNKVRSRATDYAGNVQSPTTENTFIYNTAPISQINVPADGAYYNGLASISGVASDNSGTGLSKVEITIQRLSDFQYWDGTLWTSSETWLTAVGPWVSWSYSTLPTWVDGQSYRVRSRATDNVPTVESPTSGNTFTIDTTIPSSTITYPIHGTTLPILTSITGTASDTGSGLDKVQILIEDSGTYWTGSTWGGATWLDVSGTSSWSYDSSMVLWPAGPATIVIKSRAHDNAGNVESPGLGVTITFDITFTDFSISATPTSELIGRGDNATFVIEVTSIYGNEGPGGETIVLSLSSLPAGATGGFAPLFSPTISVTIFSGSSAYSTLTVDTDASVAPGTYLITVYGDNFATSITHSVDITLDIGDFGVYVAPPNQTLVRGSADHANYTVTVKSLATFSDTVDLTVSGWSNFTFDSSAVTPTTAGTITTLTIWVPYTISTGSFNFTVYGTSGNQTHHANASIAIVTPPGFRIDDFRVTINPSQSLIGPGDSTTYTVNCTSLYRYESVVELTLVGLPDGATASFTEEIINIPTDGSVFSTLTVTTDSSILLGTYYLTVYGTSSAPLTRSAIATLDIGDYKVTTDPIIQEVVLESQSSNVEYTVIVTSLGTTGDFVDLTLTGWPNHNFAASRVLPTTSGTTTTLTINVPYTSNTGTYVLNIFGTDSNQTHSTKAILIVDMEPDFVIAVDPVSKTAEKDSTATFSAIVTSLNGFTAPVQLSVPSWPANLTGSFNPSTVTISSAGGIASSTLSIPIPADAPVGTYAFNITGTSGPISHKTSATLTITEAEEPSGPGMQCIIATSTYGSELSPEVQFLRSFRDQTVMSTFSGKQFMNVFNTWYYSFSPPVAGTIESNTPIKSMMKVVLYPLIGTLHVAAYVNSIVAGLSTELAMVTTGLVASALIGAVYLAPIALLLLYVFRRYYGLKFNTYPLKVLGGMLLVSLALLILGTFIMAPAIVMFSTAILVVSTLALGGIGLAFIVILRPLKT